MGRWLTFILALLVCIGMVSAYDVSTPAELNESVNNASTISLADDIDLGGFVWTAPASAPPAIHGKNHTIRNGYLNLPTTSAVGFFGGDFQTTFVIDNICLENMTVIGKNHVGIIFGYNGDGNDVFQANQVCIRNSLIKIAATGAGNTAGPFWGHFDAGAGSYINNSYTAHNTILGNFSSTSGGVGGVYGQGIYAGAVGNSYSYNNSIYMVGSGAGYSGFVGSTYGTSGPRNSISILNKLYNSTIQYINSFYGGSETDHNTWFTNDGGRTDTTASGNTSSVFNKTTTSPLNTWDFTTTWKLGENYPIFQWQTEEAPSPEAPQFVMYQNATTIAVGGSVYLSCNATDNMAIMEVSFSTWNTTQWSNWTTTGWNDTWVNTVLESTLDIVGNWSFKCFAMDNSSNWNMSFPLMNVTVTSLPETEPPTYFDFSGNTTALGIGGSIKISANWTDNESLSYWIFSNSVDNGATWGNGSMTAFITNTSSVSLVYTYVGTWNAKFFANDSNNNWNVTGWFNFTVEDAPPTWYGYGGNVTPPFYLGHFNYIYSDWYDDVGLNQCFLQETFPNLTSYNWSGSLNCTVPNTDCACENFGSMSPIGNHTFRWFVNDSYDNWNSTPYFSWIVESAPVIGIPQWTSYGQNATTINISQVIRLWANFTDDVSLNVSSRLLWINFSNGTSYFLGIDTLGGDCTPSGGPYTACNWTASYTNHSIAGNFTWSISQTDNENPNLFNRTPWGNFTIQPDIAPQWSARGTNVTVPFYGGDIRMYDFWTDIGLSYAYFELYNSTHLMINSTPKAYGTTNFTAGGWSGEYFRYDMNLIIPSTYAWRTCANDTINQWNCSPIDANFTLIYVPAPQYLFVYSNRTVNISIGEDIAMTVNWTSKNYPYNNISITSLVIWNDSGHVLGNSSYECWFFAPKLCNFTQVFAPTPTTGFGVYSYKFYANSTGNIGNSTPIINFNVTQIDFAPQYLAIYSNTTGNLSIWRSILLTSNWTVFGHSSDYFTNDMSYVYVVIENESHHVLENVSNVGCSFLGTLGTCNMSESWIITETDGYGQYRYKFFANSSPLNLWNSTLWINFNVSEPYEGPTWTGNEFDISSNDFLGDLMNTTASVRNITGTRVVDAVYPPLVFDLDFDGTEEYISFGQDNVYVSKGKDLTTLVIWDIINKGAISNPIIVTNFSEPMSYTLLFLTENVASPTLQEFKINYTNSTITYYNDSTNISSWLIGYDGGQMLLGCGSSGCLLAYSQLNYSGYVDNASELDPNSVSNLYGVYFNSTFHTTSILINDSGRTECFPKYATMLLLNDTYIFNTLVIDGNGNEEQVHVYRAKSNNISLETTKDIDNLVTNDASPYSRIDCDWNGLDTWGYGSYLTSNLLYRPNQSANITEYRYYVATMVSENDFDILSYYGKTEDWDKKIYTTSGFFCIFGIPDGCIVGSDTGIMGNLFWAGIDYNWTGTLNATVCARGYDVNGMATVGGTLCADNDTDEFWYESDAQYPFVHNYRTLTTSIQANHDQWIDKDNIEGINGLAMSFGTSAIRVPVKAGNVSSYRDGWIPTGGLIPWDDYLESYTGQMDYVSTDVQQNGMRITDWRINPCIAETLSTCDQKGVPRSIWDKDSNISLQFFGIDENNNIPQDGVSARLILFDNDPSCQYVTDWSLNFNPIYVDESSFIFNATYSDWLQQWTGIGVAGNLFFVDDALNCTGNATWTLQMRDNVNGTIANYTDWVEVANGGRTFLECSTCLGYSTTLNITNTTYTFPQLMLIYAETLNIGMQIFWLIIILIIVGVTWWKLYRKPIIAGALSGGEVLFLSLVGAIFHFIEWYVFFIVMLALIITTVGAVYGSMRGKHH